MENASKALMLAAEVLLGVLLLTLMVFAFQELRNFSDTVNENIQAKTIAEFNAQFTKYEAKTNLTAQDVITIGNLAKNYNESQESVQIRVLVQGVEARFSNAHTLTQSQVYEFINQYSMENKVYFECVSVHYNDETKKIDQVNLKK